MPPEVDPGAESAAAGVVAPSGGASADRGVAGPGPDAPPPVSDAPAPTGGDHTVSDTRPAPPGGAPAAPGAGPAGAGEQALDPASVAAARLAGAVGVAAGAAAGLAAILAAVVATPLGVVPGARLMAAVLLLSAAGAVACWLWPPVRYRHIRYRLDAHGVTIRRGVVWRTVTSVPRSRVQHTDVSRGPVERYFDLATLVIHTAGTRDASITLGGLGHRAALDLRDRLIEAGGGHGG